MAIIQWLKGNSIASKSFICGFCNNIVASVSGWEASMNFNGLKAAIYICPHCQNPTYFDENYSQIPGVKFGYDVNNIDDITVAALYEEARQCTSKNAFTAAVLCCRKLLMHIAVSKGATEGKNFFEYVEFLSENHFIPPDAKDWVDHIRKKGNEANHEIVIMQEGDAKDLINFVGMLLKIIFEFPAKMKQKKTEIEK